MGLPCSCHTASGSHLRDAGARPVFYGCFLNMAAGAGGGMSGRLANSRTFAKNRQKRFGTIAWRFANESGDLPAKDKVGAIGTGARLSPPASPPVFIP
jgi:hypothetical protein